MGNGLILLDTSILIDYFRKKNKRTSIFFKLNSRGYTFSISAITLFEIEIGNNDIQENFWELLLSQVQIFPFQSSDALKAAEIFIALKRKNKLVESKDLFIAATALANNLPLATLNLKHFERIEGLDLIEY